MTFVSSTIWSSPTATSSDEQKALVAIKRVLDDDGYQVAAFVLPVEPLNATSDERRAINK